MKWLTKIFNREVKFNDYPKNISWMLKDDLSPNIKNLKHCKEFHALIGVKQSPKWHKEGDVWNHTLAVSKEMFKLISDKSWFLTDYDKKVLMIAALCHDLGKATTTYFDKNEQDWKCKNHGYASEQITRELIFDQDINTREEICWLVRWHMSFHYILQKTHSEQFQEITRLSQGFSTVEKLLILNLADSRGSKSEDNSEDKINERLKSITELAMSNKCYIKPFECHRKSPDCNMYVMIGLPGSGKDTYIKKFLKDLPCICRDDIREEVTDGQVLGRKLMLDGQGEKAVTNIVNERIKNCCINKKDFVINQTSLKKKYRLDFKELAFKYANVNVIYVYVEAPSIQECINRRGGGKWNDIIKKMWSCFEFPDKSECNKMIIYKQ